MAYYSNSQSSAMPAAPDDTPGGDPNAQAQPPEDDKMEGQSTIVPMSLFPDPPKPGDVCDFKVVAVHGDEVEVEYAKDGESSSGGDDTMSRMSAMADKS